MKRFLSLLLCVLIMASHASVLAEGADVKAGALPDEVRQFFASAQFSGWQIGENACCLMENTPGGNFFFAVAQKDGRNVLYGFEKKNGAYAYWLKTDNCLPQGDGFFQVRHRTGYLYLFNEEKMDLGDTLSILFTRAGNEEQGDTELFFQVGQNGQFHLTLLCYDYLWNEARFTDQSIAYYFEGDYLGTASGTVETNLRYFSLSAFPRTLKEAREKLTSPPAIPSGELTAQKIKFTGGQKYPVYAGPGAEYERPAGGKASVSTNDWIQVFGSESGYILIQYAISASQMRFGWIDQSALPKDVAVNALRFDYADAGIAAPTFLTDDPLNSQNRVRSLSAGQSVKWLTTMGAWAYVEVSSGSQPVRGFVPSSAIRRAETLSASFSGGVYTAQASGVLLNGRADMAVTVEGPAAWNAAGADAVAGYQVYANNLPVQTECTAVRGLSSGAWVCVFTLSAVLPENAGLLALCPVYAASGPKADESLIFPLGSAARQAVQTAPAESGGAWAGYQTATVRNPDPKDRLHLRKYAYGSAPSFGKYYNGTVAVVLPDSQDGAEWVHVRIGGAEGYMEAKYLAFQADADQVPSVQPIVTIDNASGTGLNLRTGQSTDSAVLRLLANGEQVTVLGLSEDWLHVRAGDETGYIRATGVSPRVPYTYGTPGGDGANARVRSTVSKSALYDRFSEAHWDAGDPEGDIVGYLYPGDRVTVLSYQGEYARISWKGGLYWTWMYNLETIAN